MADARVAILGGGPAGVGGAYQLRKLDRARVTLFEQGASVGGNAGSFEVETSGGRAHVARTDRSADVTLTADTLGSLYLAGPRVTALHRAGRIGGTDDAVRRFAAMADLSDPPYNLTGF